MHIIHEFMLSTTKYGNHIMIVNLFDPPSYLIFVTDWHCCCCSSKCDWYPILHVFQYFCCVCVSVEFRGIIINISDSNCYQCRYCCWSMVGISWFDNFWCLEQQQKYIIKGSLIMTQNQISPTLFLFDEIF